MAREVIKCREFLRRDRRVKGLVAGINDPVNPVQLTAKLAGELLRQADALLGCGAYRAAQQECADCRGLSRSRKMLAELILKSAAVPALSAGRG